MFLLWNLRFTVVKKQGAMQSVWEAMDIGTAVDRAAGISLCIRIYHDMV
jgi:hypothetical protein